MQQQQWRQIPSQGPKEFKYYYETLGVKRTAPSHDIEDQFAELDGQYEQQIADAQNRDKVQTDPKKIKQGAAAAEKFKRTQRGLRRTERSDSAKPV